MTINDVTIYFTSARFGDISVPESSVITLPHGMTGFPDRRRFVLLDYIAPFSWLHSVEDPNLAFVVMDGGELGPSYELKPPYGDKECDSPKWMSTPFSSW